MMDGTNRRLVELFRSVFSDLKDRSEAEVMEARRGELASWDSGGHLMLLTCLEEEFQVVIPNEMALSIDSFPAAREAVSA